MRSTDSPRRRRPGCPRHSFAGQQESVARALRQHWAANSRLVVIVDHRAEVVGTITPPVHHPRGFRSCSVSHWIAATAQGQGLAAQALRRAKLYT